jgi:Ig-like domain-containing protein
MLLAGTALGVGCAAAQEGPDASVAEVRLPARLPCGETFRASVTMLNTGALTWTSADRLAAVGGEDAFTEAVTVGIPAGVEVAPGESHTFRLLLTAPEIALPSARTAWRMKGANGEWFGETAAQAVPVECPARIDDAELLEADMPARLVCAQTRAMTITVRNAGNTRWSKQDGYALGAVEGGHDFRSPDLIPLPDGAVVGPASVHTFTATLVAPDAAGTYRLEWRMARPAGGFFGPSVEQSVKVVCPP